MPNETMVAKGVEELEKQIRQNSVEIDRLKRKVKQLSTNLSPFENDELDGQLSKEEILEFGTLSNGTFKGKINWMNPYLISVTTSDEDAPTEVLVFKHALAFIRKPEEKPTSRRGMYI